MMDTNIMIMSVVALGGVAIISAAALSGWRSWLRLKMSELEKIGSTANAPVNTVNTRIELADLRERLRKLEAIAAGVDL